MVVPYLTAVSISNEMIFRASLESRFALGSSAKIMGALLAKATDKAALCLSPADNSAA
jgi:hypothetical protein